jgi:hypothetical protein
MERPWNPSSSGTVEEGEGVRDSEDSEEDILILTKRWIGVEKIIEDGDYLVCLVAAARLNRNSEVEKVELRRWS